MSKAISVECALCIDQSYTFMAQINHAKRVWAKIG